MIQNSVHGKQILVTGANGFIGQALCKRLLQDGAFVRAAVRNTGASEGVIQDVPNGETYIIGDIDGDTDWHNPLEGIDTVVHLAAHSSAGGNESDAATFMRVNVDATRALAMAAAGSGVKRFIFASTIKVCGECSPVTPRQEPRQGWRRFVETDPPQPQGPYGKSKWQAEQHVNAIAEQSALEVVILRPPLVFGPGVHANFLQLMSLVQRGLPLPLACISNCRSLIYVENLVDALSQCIGRSTGGTGTYLVSDSEFSTPGLVRALAKSMERPARLLPMPPSVIRHILSLLGKRQVFDRLFGSLAVDSSKFKAAYRWSPPVSASEGLKRTARWFMQSSAS